MNIAVHAFSIICVTLLLSVYDITSSSQGHK